MANIRGLKKDIDYLVSQVLLDCVQYINYFENADKDAAYKVVEQAITMHRELRIRANHPDGKDNPGMVKKHFNAIGKDLLIGCDKAYESLGKLVEKSA